jgi:hypothetical protein
MVVMLRIWRMRGRCLGRLRGSWGLLSEFIFIAEQEGEGDWVLMRGV